MLATDRRRIWSVISVVAAASVAVPIRAHAADAGEVPSAADAAAAEALFVEAKRLMKDGQVALACARFAESERLDPAGGTLLNLADCFEKNGQLASAWGTFRDAAVASARGGRAVWEAQADARAKLLEPRVPRLTIHVGGSRPPGLVIRRNEVGVPATLWGAAIPLDPGTQVITASAPGRVPWSRTVVIGADPTRVEVDVPALLETAPAPAPSSTGAPAPVRSAGTSPARVASIGLLATGAAGLGAGAIFGMTAIHKNGEASARCPQPPSCVDASAVSLTSEARRAAGASTVAFAGGGALIAVGTILFLASSREPPVQPTVTVSRGTWAGGIGGRF